MRQILPVLAVGLLLVAGIVVAAIVLAMLGSGPVDPGPSGATRPASGVSSELATRVTALERRVEELEQSLADAEQAAGAERSRAPADDHASDALSAEDVETLRQLISAQRQRKELHVASQEARSSYTDRGAADAGRFGLSVKEMEDLYRKATASPDADDMEERSHRLRAFVDSYRGSQRAGEALLALAIYEQFMLDDAADAEASFREIIAGYAEATEEDGTPLRALAMLRLGVNLAEDPARLREAEAVLVDMERDYPDVKHPLGSNTLVRILRATIAKAKE